MKKLWVMVLLTAWTAPGCVTLPGTPEPAKPAPPPKKEAPVAARPKRPTTLVTPEEVSDANAHDMGKALWDELDRDSQTGSR
jgi:hypothetical protein